MVKHDPEQAVLELIISTNRPYSPQLLADNLQVKGIKLAAVKRALDVLVEKNKICCKVTSMIKTDVSLFGYHI